MGDVEALKNILMSSAVPLHYLNGQNEGHGWRNKDNRDFLFYSEVNFLKTYSGGDNKNDKGEK